MKRIADILLVLASSPVWAPVMALVALAVRIADGAPVFFVSSRAGKDGVPFAFVKFRTMRDGEGDDGERITRLGRILRATSLDELPQLIHVLSGKMALVGPRPLPVRYLDRYSAFEARRHEVRPGITGWAQVNGRNGLDWAEKFRLDVWYVDNVTPWLDVKIILLTIIQALCRSGVNHAGCSTMYEFTGSSTTTA